jgi:hypothetical protein
MKFDGEMVYLWRASISKASTSVATSSRPDKAAALTSIKKAPNRLG